MRPLERAVFVHRLTLTFQPPSQCLGWHLDLTLTDTMFLHVFCPDTNSRVSESFRNIFPEIHSDLASKEVPGHILLDIDNDTESTAL